MAKKATKVPVETENTTPARGSAHWTPFEILHREIDHLFDNFNPFGRRHTPGRSLFDPDIAWPKMEKWQVAPAIDLVEKDGSYEISAELPGLDEENIEVKVANGALTIKGEKSEEKEEHEKEYHLSERRFGSFHRSFRLPDGVDTDKVDASFSKGVLTVTLPKSEEAKQNEKKIKIKAA